MVESESRGQSSQWFVRRGGDEQGPLSFDELAQLAREGKLTASDEIRKDGSPLWLSAQRVAGLFSTQTRIPLEVPPEGHTNAPVKTPARRPVSTSAKRQFELGTVRSLAIGGVLLLFMTLVGIWSWDAWENRASRRFPAPVELTSEAFSGDLERTRRSALRAPPPIVPSIPGLRVAVPKEVPGLQAAVQPFSPSLTEDLQRIVFAAMSPGGTGYDLFEAQRTSVSQPFHDIRLISSCASSETEAYPSFSSDGLRLLFIRSDTEPQIMFARRASLREEFGPPMVCRIEGFDDADLIVDYPQFVDDGTATFGFRGRGEPSRGNFLVPLRDTPDEWSSLEVLEYADPMPPYFLISHRLRAYFGSPSGFGFVVRRQVSNPFGLSIPLAGEETTGPIEGAIWVSPKEDLFFYCSPGQGKSLGNERKLWMIQL